MSRRDRFDIGDREGTNKAIHEFDDAHPDHWEPPADLPGVNRTRVWHGHKLYQQAPYLFWKIFGRLDEKPLHCSLINNSFTDLRVCQAAVDEAIRVEGQTKEAKKQ